VASVRDDFGVSGFPLVGWLSFVAVAGLGLIPMLLWFRLRQRLHTP
jgi:hypothetical protein